MFKKGLRGWGALVSVVSLAMAGVHEVFIGGGRTRSDRLNDPDDFRGYGYGFAHSGYKQNPVDYCTPEQLDNPSPEQLRKRRKRYEQHLKCLAGQATARGRLEERHIEGADYSWVIIDCAPETLRKRFDFYPSPDTHPGDKS